MYRNCNIVYDVCSVERRTDSVLRSVFACEVCSVCRSNPPILKIIAKGVICLPSTSCSYGRTESLWQNAMITVNFHGTREWCMIAPVTLSTCLFSVASFLSSCEMCHEHRFDVYLHATAHVQALVALGTGFFPFLMPALELRHIWVQ